MQQKQLRLDIFAGKGGVGKTQCAVSTALHFARSSKIALVDQDGGHSVRATLRLENAVTPNELAEVMPNLFCAVVENTDFVNIMQSKQLEWPLARYLAQFTDDYGFLPLCDMATNFFGIPTDVPLLQKLLVLVRVLHELEQSGFERAIIDVEPTAGLERLISNASATARSLRNLQNQGVFALAALGLKWPDIAGYLQGDYIKNAEIYATRLERAVMYLKHAVYIVVCTPEIIPIEQAFEVRKKIEKFGGLVHGFVVNNLGGWEHEKPNIELLQKSALHMPIVRVMRHPQLQSECDRINILSKIGGHIAEMLPTNGL